MPLFVTLVAQYSYFTPWQILEVISMCLELARCSSEEGSFWALRDPKTFVPFWGKWGWLLGRPIFFSPLTLWTWGATLFKKMPKNHHYRPILDSCHYFEVLYCNYNGEIGQKYIGHNFWLGGPIETSSTRLNSILQDLFFRFTSFQGKI